MRRVLLLRLDAPLMSFGGVQVDQRGVTRDFPAKSMLTGLLGNALGFEHKHFDRLSRLQRRLRYAVRQDRAGQEVVDYQTVDLGQDFMREGWTTRGAPEGRKGGKAKTGTHIRYRHHLADALYTIALQLEPEHENPTLGDLAAALRHPARPLFIGRKPCLPSSPLVLDIVEARTLRDALRSWRRESGRADAGSTFRAWWDDHLEPEGEGHRMPVTDERDWANQIHVGRRFIRSGRIRYREEHDDDA